MIFIAITTSIASIENIFNNYIPNGKITLTVLSFIILIMLITILYECIKSWRKNWNKHSSDGINPTEDVAS